MVFMSVKFRGKWIKLRQSIEGVYGKEENENKQIPFKSTAFLR